MFLPIIFPLGIGGGKPPPPTTSGPIIFAIVAFIVFGITGGLGYLAFGLAGLWVIPMLAGLLAWCFAWGWLAVQCFDHEMNSRGVTAGLYFAAGFLSAGIALASFVGALTATVATNVH